MSSLFLELIVYLALITLYFQTCQCFWWAKNAWVSLKTEEGDHGPNHGYMDSLWKLATVFR